MPSVPLIYAEVSSLIALLPRRRQARQDRACLGTYAGAPGHVRRSGRRRAPPGEEDGEEDSFADARGRRTSKEDGAQPHPENGAGFHPDPTAGTLREFSKHFARRASQRDRPFPGPTGLPVGPLNGCKNLMALSLHHLATHNLTSIFNYMSRPDILNRQSAAYNRHDALGVI